MRILFFSHYFPPESNAPASRTYEMCRRWAAAGHDVRIITCAPNAPEGRLYEGYKNALHSSEMIDGIEVTRVWTFLAANKGIVLRFINYVSYMLSACLAALFIDRPDVIVATTPQLFCGFAGWLSSLVLRVPLVLECRDLFAEGITNLTRISPNSVVIRAVRRLEFALYRQGERLVTVGPGYMHHLLEGGVPENHVTIITNGVDRDFFDPTTNGDATRESLGIINRYVVTYAGTIGMAHGLGVVLNAAESLKNDGHHDVIFVLAGDGADRVTLEQEANARNLTNVIFTGRIPKTAMPSLLAASDCCFIHLRKTPLFTSVLPSKMFEMAHMKKPIILGVTGDAAEIVEAAQCGICIEPENATEFTNAIHRLMRAPDEAREMGERGWRYTSTHYDRGDLAAKYLALLTSVVEERRTHRKSHHE